VSLIQVRVTRRKRDKYRELTSNFSFVTNRKMNSFTFILLMILVGVLSMASLTSGTCSTSYCTSPDGSGGYDCYAGSSVEPCTCSQGTASTTGATTQYQGVTYYEYTCCDSESNSYGYESVGKDCGDYNGDASCFAGSETLLLESGMLVSMENVKLGDRILVAALDGNFEYADVIALPHEKNNRETFFVELVTIIGSLKVTPSHLVMVGACDNTMNINMKLTRAGDVPLGSCMATSQGSVEVTAAHVTKSHGVYSVVTAHADGLLMVNGFKASSFAVNHAVANAYYHVHRALYQVAPFLVRGMASVSATLGAISNSILSI
jgi:hypothetical protein